MTSARRYFISFCVSVFALLMVTGVESLAADMSQQPSQKAKKRSRGQPSSQSQSQAQAQAPSQAGKSSSANPKGGVAATVTSDGAIVYVQPDQDSGVIVMLPVGQKIRVSKNATEGADRFHKIRVKTREGSRVGYISAIDIRLGDAPTAAQAKNSKGAKTRPRKNSAREDKKREEMYFSRYVGLLVGSSEYKESISNVDASTNFPIYGLKITGPDLFISGGVVMDFNLALHYGAPTYYESLSSVRPTGFVLFMDTELLLPFLHNENSMVYLGVGPLLVLSKFSVVNTGRVMDLSSVNVGATLELGGALRFSKVALRLEGKYFVEKQSYKALQLSIQNEF